MRRFTEDEARRSGMRRFTEDEARRSGMRRFTEDEARTARVFAIAMSALALAVLLSERLF